MTEHERQRHRPVAVERVQVGVADAAGGQPHPHLVADRVGEREIGRPQRPGAFEDLRLHVTATSSRSLSFSARFSLSTSSERVSSQYEPPATIRPTIHAMSTPSSCLAMNPV